MLDNLKPQWMEAVGCFEAGTVSTCQRFSVLSVSLYWLSASDLWTYRGADKSLARQGRKKATAKEDFDFHTGWAKSRYTVINLN